MIQRSEPMFNIPPVVIATVAVLVLVHALRMLVLSDAEDLRFLLIELLHIGKETAQEVLHEARDTAEGDE